MHPDQLDIDEELVRRLVPYYRQTNPIFVALGARTIEQILTDPPAG